MVEQTVIRGGRVIDPESRSEADVDVLITDGRVTRLGRELTAPEGARELDARGCVVGPGFVDLHSHVHSVAGHRLQAFDGVTTVLDLEAGLMPIETAYRRAGEQGRPLNYGFAASWGGARAVVLTGMSPDASLLEMLPVLDDRRWQRSSSPSELAQWLDLISGELAAGGLGIGVLQGYAPQSAPSEFTAVCRLAAAVGVPVFSHVRDLIECDPATPVDGSEEVVIAAAETGAQLHHCHVNSTSRKHVDRVLATLDRARRAGSRVTVEAYPYGVGSTGVGAYFLDPDRLGRWGIGPQNIVMLASGERVGDDARLRELRATDPGAACLVEYLDETDPGDAASLRNALAHPDSIVASDAMPVLWPKGVTDSDEWPLPAGSTTHPRTAGTFARSLRLMVREQGLWTWVEAFRRASYLPARVLDDVAPAMHGKGRLAPGADADLVVLDPSAVTDDATYADPTRPSRGVRHLLVAGTALIRDGVLDVGARPGHPIRAAL